MLAYEVPGCEPIDDAAREMTAMANANQEAVQADFNGVTLIANPGDDARTIVATYYGARAKRAVEEEEKKRRTDVSDLVDEYQDIATEFKGMECPDDDRVAKTLHGDHDWTDDGAQVLVDLATRYGAFVLRSALALAIALDIEDGTEEM